MRCPPGADPNPSAPVGRNSDPTNGCCWNRSGGQKGGHFVAQLRSGIRRHRDGTGHELCWHHPQPWGPSCGIPTATTSRSSATSRRSPFRSAPVDRERIGGCRPSSEERADARTSVENPQPPPGVWFSDPVLSPGSYAAEELRRHAVQVGEDASMRRTRGSRQGISSDDQRDERASVLLARRPSTLFAVPWLASSAIRDTGHGARALAIPHRQTGERPGLWTSESAGRTSAATDKE
jgi:hypothetical protein